MPKETAEPLRAINAKGRVGINFTDPGRTKQSFRDECDVNTIMKNWARTGTPNHQNPAQPWYGDFSNADDYQTAVNLVIDAENRFADLPAVVRDRMGNNPAKLLEFLNDEENREEAVELGLVDRASIVPMVPIPEPVEAENTGEPEQD